MIRKYLDKLMNNIMCVLELPSLTVAVAALPVNFSFLLVGAAAFFFASFALSTCGGKKKTLSPTVVVVPAVYHITAST